MAGDGWWRDLSPRSPYCNPSVTAYPTHRRPVHKSSQSGQQLPHPPTSAAQPIGDALLANPRAVPPAGAVALGFEDPGEQQDREQQQGKGPSREASGGHGGECCGGLQGAAPAPGDLISLAPNRPSPRRKLVKHYHPQELQQGLDRRLRQGQHRQRRAGHQLRGTGGPDESHGLRSGDR